MIARSADFYGPSAGNGVPNVLVFQPLSAKKKPSWLVNDSVPHSMTYTPDAARGLVELSGRASAWNQTWHIPTAPNPPTGKELIAMAAKEFGAAPGYRLLGRTMIRVAGWFDPPNGHTGAGLTSDGFHRRFAVRAALPLAALLAIAALGGILLPSTYARETATWAAQGIGQDWVNLLVVAPWIALSGHRAARGSRPALLLLGGGLVYLVYGFLAYAFAVHFNALFLLYCALLGLSFYALASLGGILHGTTASAWFVEERVPVRLPGVTLLVVGALFALVWLSEVVPALLRGAAPPSVVEAGLLTNPVHVLDLSLLLPGMVLSGISLLRRRPLGLLLSPLLLGFAGLMVSAIAGMVLVMVLRGVPVQWPLAALFAVVAAVAFAVLAKLLAAVREG